MLFSDFFGRYLEALDSWEEISVDKHYQNEYNRYRHVGHALKEQDAVKSIVKSIGYDQQSVNDLTLPPFYFIEGHSGVGKTQFPFAIRAGGVGAVHLVMAQPDDHRRHQAVYRCLTRKSSLFLDAVDRDVKHHQLDEKDVSVEALSNSPKDFCSVAFIRFELKRYGFTDLDEVKYSTKSLRKYVIRKQKEGIALPVFFLDEVLSSVENISENERERTKFRFSRNVFSAAGLIVVLMGTNSKAANFTHLFSYSRQSTSGGLCLWCRIITDLPTATEDSLQCFRVDPQLNTLSQNHRALATFLKSQCFQCTPWFVQLLSEALENILNKGTDEHDEEEADDKQIMDQIFKHMADSVKAAKERSCGSSFVFGQIAMHLAWHKEDRQSKIDKKSENEAAVISDCFISHHFARPKGGNFDLYIDESTLCDAEGHKYVPEAYYRSAQRESFMYLMFGGGPTEIDFLPPFRNPDDETRLTTNGALAHCRLDVHYNGKALNYLNDRAPNRDGNALEAMAVLAMEMASHAGGTGGLPVHQFLGFVAVELLPSYCPHWKWQSDASSPSQLMPEALSSSTVPYLSSANDSWPAEIHAVPSCRFGNLIRT